MKLIFKIRNFINRNRSKVLIVGDSIAHDAPWHRIYPKNYIVNEAIKGAEVSELGFAKGIENVSKVIIWGGVNNVYNTFKKRDKFNEEKVLTDYIKLIKSIKNEYKGAKVITYQVLPFGPRHHSRVSLMPENVNSFIKSLNSRLKNIRLKNVKFKKTSHKLTDEMTYDGVHLTKFGYKKIFGK